MKRRAGILFVLIAISILLLQFGCTAAPQVHANLDQSIREIFNEGVQTLKDRPRLEAGSSAVEFTFAELLCQAVAHDPELKQFRNSYDKSLIELEQAKSIIWPRISLDLSAEIPFEGGVKSDDAIYNGGLALRYNITDAFFLKDAVYVNEVKRRQVLQQKVQIVKRIYHELAILLCDIECKRQQIERLSIAFKAADDALARATAIGEKAPNGIEEIEKWDAKARSFAKALKENQWRLKLLEEKLNFMIGVDYGAKVAVENAAQYLPRRDKVDSMESITVHAVEQAWNQRHDVEIEKMNLFLAEMEIVNAKRKRLPRFTASLGVGDIYVDSLNDSAFVVPRFEMSIPLFDMGDVKRQIRRAEKNRDIVKTNLLSCARTIVGDLWDASLELNLALENLQESRQNLNREDRKLDNMTKLVANRRADLLQQYEAQMDKEEAEIEFVKAIYDLRRAALKFRKVRGDSLPDELMERCDDNLSSGGGDNINED